MPKGFSSKLQAVAHVEPLLEPNMKVNAEETRYGWTITVEDGEGNWGDIVQNGEIHWWAGYRVLQNKDYVSMDRGKWK